MITKFQIPTGEIYVADAEKGKLEFLSLGDYGAAQNVKADFLGLTEEINGVPNGEVMPLSEKWVITISTQYGCSMRCRFCDVPKVGKGVNATLADLTMQVTTALSQHPEVGGTKRLNVHYARMGEPTFNEAVLTHARGLLKEVRPLIGRSHVHPVVSTMMPKSNKHLIRFLQDWVEIKNEMFRGAAGLQLSINSTDENQRREMFNGSALSLEEISGVVQNFDMPRGRKYALNFALADGYQIDATKLANLFPPSRFMVKITPMHRTTSCIDRGIDTTQGYEYFTPYQEAEEQLKDEGFDVLIFVPSKDEDEGLITCGNAILSGTAPRVPYTQSTL